MPEPPSLAQRLDEALTAGDLRLLDDLADARPASSVDELLTLLTIHELWSTPIPTLGGRERFQNHPAVAALKWRLEAAYVERLEARTAGAGPVSADTCAAMRRLARQDDDGVYDWLASTADHDQVVQFLAIEGGPDAGFDDLVAACQMGIHGGPKVVMGANYWDEMGRGHVDDVHTVLHDRMVAALDLPRIPRSDLPASALERTALDGVLATNRWLQPELVGSLGMTELQAGQRCRKVVTALKRVGAPADALPFYEEHADTDPRHGKEWLDGVVAPLVEAEPSWGQRIVRGAAWRAEVNRRLFGEVLTLVRDGDEVSATA